MVVQNIAGDGAHVTKDPQCRHSEKQGFVSYATQIVAGKTQYKATCSNCGSAGAWITPLYPPTSLGAVNLAKDAARNSLMLVEAQPLVP